MSFGCWRSTARAGPTISRDLLFLRGIDLALVPANVLAHPSTAAAFGPNLPQRLTFVAQLYSEEIHILAGRGISPRSRICGARKS